MTFVPLHVMGRTQSTSRSRFTERHYSISSFRTVSFDLHRSDLNRDPYGGMWDYNAEEPQ